MKKTVRVPVLPEAAPPVAAVNPERTREIANDVALPEDPSAGQAAVPESELNDEVTVPVHSSIESSLTFELLRRQSKDDEDKR